MVGERNYSEKLCCSKTTRKLIIEDCVVMYLKHHPELKGMTITQNQILYQIARFYLKE